MSQPGTQQAPPPFVTWRTLVVPPLDFAPFTIMTIANLRANDQCRPGDEFQADPAEKTQSQALGLMRSLSQHCSERKGIRPSRKKNLHSIIAFPAHLEPSHRESWKHSHDGIAAWNASESKAKRTSRVN
ncbi:hypothetical protein PCANC_06373 [Puccinia coronata f. sp. avenae]|uniref:Uncharacterized protein n=1 Tax=Puccinia coronata f. sp. avenae TaxID=200324 RepID=A0A2N5U9H7_9BASI|nr:hypothetical protein PCANC_25067 [Puccinia coronata f. sp. avenae]PLW34393.1 hypothetical protein PCASD_14299 [Puccinia coronata f. sp. avenae]PLW54075.1 hypothetical protein PCANC_06373 [Puccinia coronata f. sp. avenae]